MKTKLPRNGHLVAEVIEGIKTDPNIDWVRSGYTGNKVQPLELWIPSQERWVRVHDGYITGPGGPAYARWLGRRAIRKAISKRIVPV